MIFTILQICKYVCEILSLNIVAMLKVKKPLTPYLSEITEKPTGLSQVGLNMKLKWNGSAMNGRKALLVILYVLLFLLVLTPVLHAQKVYTLAVMDLNAYGISELLVKNLSNEIRFRIADLTKRQEYKRIDGVDYYNIVERTEIDKILDEFELDFSGCVSDSCAIEFGKMLQMDRMVVGSVGLVGKTYTVSLRLIDIVSTKTLEIANRNYQGEIDDVLTEVVPLVVRDMFIGDRDAQNVDALQGKSANKAFYSSLFLPGLGQSYAGSSGGRIAAFSVGAFFSWYLAINGYSETQNAKDNREYLYSVDPTGSNKNYTVFSSYNEKDQTGSEWKEEENFNNTMFIVFSAFSVALHTWAAIDAKNQMGKNYSSLRYGIYSDPMDHSMTLTLTKRF